jgi:hypothetical protein
MALNILKLCVGVDDVDQLRRIQASRLREQGTLLHFTRHRPRRADEIVGAGSLFWIIRGYVQVRQVIVDIQSVSNQEGKRCAFVLEPQLVLTEHQPRRPHQGWRYLEAADAPPDLPNGEGAGPADLPAPLARTLKEIGAW